MFRDMELAYSHRASRVELTKRLGKGWIGWSDLAKALRVRRATLSALIKLGIVPPGTRIGAYRAYSRNEADEITAKLKAIRTRAAKAYPVRQRDGSWKCEACGRVANNRSLSALIAHTRSCHRVWANLDSAENFGEAYRIGRRYGLRQAGLREVEKEKDSVVRGQLMPYDSTKKGESDMPEKNTEPCYEALISVDKADLVYALSQLVEVGKVTFNDVQRLLGTRQRRIEALEAELCSLKEKGVSLSNTAVTPKDILLQPKVGTWHWDVPGFGKAPPEGKALALTFKGKWTAAKSKRATPVGARLDPKLVGRFNALVLHHCKSPQAKRYYYALAKKIGLADAIQRLLQMIEQRKAKSGTQKTPKKKTLRPKAKVSKKPLKKGSPAHLAFRRVHGTYLGLMRHLTSPKQRHRIKTIAKEQGIPAAVKVLQKLRGKKV